MKLKARVLSALLAAAMSVTLIGVPVLADGAVLPTADFSLDFSGFSKDSSQASCGITASGAKAQGATVTATAEYLTVNEAKVSPTEGFSYLDFEVKERKDGKNQYGVRVDFQDAFGKKTDGSSEITADFWMNIPGETLTGKYAYYFEFGEDIGGKVNVGLQNLILKKTDLPHLRATVTVFSSARMITVRTLWENGHTGLLRRRRFRLKKKTVKPNTHTPQQRT